MLYFYLEPEFQNLREVLSLFLVWYLMRGRYLMAGALILWLFFKGAVLTLSRRRGEFKNMYFDESTGEIAFRTDTIGLEADFQMLNLGAKN